MILALTPGDPEGIGPEITWKAIQKYHGDRQLDFSLLCIGAREPFEQMKVPIIEADPNHLTPPDQKEPFVWLLPAPPPKDTSLLTGGFQSGWSIQTATELIQKGKAAALVTGPISKERLQKGGFKYSGHTDFLADLCRVPEVTMMLANSQLRISLVTVHIALKDVSARLTRKGIRRAVTQTASALRDWMGIKIPHIAVAALNPHAGEEGLFGREEIEIIEPELKAIEKDFPNQFRLSGPLPADTLFAKHILAPKAERYDGVICMYHDQGLIPVKLLDFPNTVNITLGLPIVRTSVDHGTGFDIAGQNKADPSSLISAIETAAQICREL